ncbi:MULTISPECIES: autotransporter family protein [Cupriavidus]
MPRSIGDGNSRGNAADGACAPIHPAGNGRGPVLRPGSWRFMALSAVLLLFLPGERASAQCAVTDASTVTCSGNNPSGLTIVPPPPPGPDVTVTVAPGATINGPVVIDNLTTLTFQNNGQINGDITVTRNGNLTFDQNGTFGGTTLSVTGTGANSLIVRAGRSVNTVAMSGAQNQVDNFGVLNNAVGLNATTSNTVINRTGAAINQLTLAGPLNTIDNDGLFNQGLAFGNGHTVGNQYDNTVINRANGVINGINSTGGAYVSVDNGGVINGPVNLGAGNDLFANRTQTNGAINMGDGNDIFALLDGTICCTVNLGNGNDLAFVFRGTISSDIQAGAGNDTLAWSGGQIVAGIRMGDGNDYALFTGLNATNLVPGLLIDGGLGNDRLVWQNTQNGSTGLDVSQLTYWESIALNVRSQLTFKNYSTLTLGDPGTGTGTLSIDSSSAALAGNGTHAVRPWDPTVLVNLSNAGTIDLTNGPATATDRFVVYGNYIGQNGRLNLQTVLGADNSPSDQLVIQKNSTATATPTASGLTTLSVSNLNGAGAMTTGDGIRVVDAVGGAATAPGAFALGARVAAGVYEYQLFRGGVTASAANDNAWFLRSSVISPTVPPSVLPAPAPQLPPVPPTTLPAPAPIVPAVPLPPAPAPLSPPTTLPAPLPPAPAVPAAPLPAAPPPAPPSIDPPPSPPPGETAPPGSTPPPATETPAPLPPAQSVTPPAKPLIRPEIPGYVLMPAVAQQMGIATIGTFHERRGDQSLLDTGGLGSNAWVRALGDGRDQRWSSKIGGIDYQLSPEIHSTMWGVQVGSDLFARHDDEGREDRLGAFYAHTETHGSIFGNTLALDGNRSGDLNVTGDSVGLYWTHIGPNRWYLDTVAMYTRLRGNAGSNLGVGATSNGNAFAASLESGIPLPLNDSWVLEPQGQIVWQHVSFGDTRDPYSSIGYHDFDAFTARLGLRLENNMLVRGLPWQSFVSADVWHNFAKTANVTFGETNVATSLGNTSLELRGGVTVKWSKHVATYLSVSYVTRLGEQMQHGVGGMGGVRIRW